MLCFQYKTAYHIININNKIRLWEGGGNLPLAQFQCLEEKWRVSSILLRICTANLFDSIDALDRERETKQELTGYCRTIVRRGLGAWCE